MKGETQLSGKWAGWVPDEDAQRLVLNSVRARFGGLDVRCGECGSKFLQIEDTRGWSDISGVWGGIEVECLLCGVSMEIFSS